MEDNGLITLDDKAKIWSSRISNLLRNFKKQEKSLFFRGRTTGIYRGFASMLDDDYPCYLRFSEPVSHIERGFRIGLVVLKPDSGFPKVRFGTEFFTDKEFRDLPHYIIYDYTRGYAKKSIIRILWAFIKRMRFRQLLHMFIKRKREDGANERKKLYSDIYENDENIGKQCEYTLVENTDGYTLKKNDEIIGIIDRLREVDGRDREKIDKWNFRPSEEMAKPITISGRIRTYISKYMWLFNGGYKFYI